MLIARLKPRSRLKALPIWRPASIVATWFGIGLIPSVPGTWGSLAALPFAWIIVVGGGPWALVLAIVLVFAAGCWASDVYERDSGGHDPGPVVIDEVAAQWLTLIAVPADPVLYAIGFILFRIADILKPWPANLIDRRVAGGIGIMLDDIFAAVYAGTVLYLVYWISADGTVF